MLDFMCVECMMFNEFGLWFPPYKIDVKTNFLLPMATILINNWDIYSWHRLVRTFVWLSIVSCQSLSHFTLFPNPSSIQCHTNPSCKIAFAFVRHMLRILHANTFMCEVACSQSVTLYSLHSFVIYCIVVTNCAKAFSIEVDEFILSLNPTMAPIERLLYSMVVSPLNSIIPSSPSRCSCSSSSLDSISSGICHGSTNMWPNLPQCDPYHVPQ
jgi:hypothetical protein